MCLWVAVVGLAGGCCPCRRERGGGGFDAHGELKSQKDVCWSCCLVRNVRVDPCEQSREVRNLKCVLSHGPLFLSSLPVTGPYERRTTTGECPVGESSACGSNGLGCGELVTRLRLSLLRGLLPWGDINACLVLPRLQKTIGKSAWNSIKI